MPEQSAPAPATEWTAREAEQMYHTTAWGASYFFVNDAGNVAVRPEGVGRPDIDVMDVVKELKERGVHFPALIRFQDLLHTRVKRLNEAFRRSMEEAGYEGRYQGVFPVKVNQLREVVEEILEAGEPFHYGLECGSKAELIATLPYIETDEQLLISNGYKDAEMMRLMLAGQKLGKNVMPVVERHDEFELLRKVADEPISLDPSGDGAPSAPEKVQFGVRARLSTHGAGLWSESGGEGSKFGLSISEIIQLVRELKELPGMSFRLLHYHLGSQLASVENVRLAALEGARVYAWLRQQGMDVRYVDIGGGLGVTYEAGNADVRGGIDYTLGQYTRAVVESFKQVCDEQGVPHPILVSESGRAVSAYHSMLVVEVLDTREKGLESEHPEDVPPHPFLAWVEARFDRLRSPDTDLTALALDVESLRAEATSRFRSGDLSLEQKAFAEGRLWHLMRDLRDEAVRRGPLSPALRGLDKQLADHYLCDFSVFRSMVDHWAIGQRFPIMPLHRLDEEPTRRGTLVDLTCDSDGKVANFICPKGDKHALELHTLKPGEPYYLGVFLMGAYQDIMGDMHNLFGRVTEAHVYLDEEEPGNFYVEKILFGQTIKDILGLVQYFPNDLERRMDKQVRRSVKAGRIRPKEGVDLLDLYRQAFKAYTYIDVQT